MTSIVPGLPSKSKSHFPLISSVNVVLNTDIKWATPLIMVEENSLLYPKGDISISGLVL